MPAPLLLLQGITLTFGGKPLLTNADLSVGAGERLSLVGRNGAGKSTLLKIAAGTVEPDAGTRFVQPGATIRYLPQEPDLTGFATVAAFVESGLGPSDDPHRARRLLEALGLAADADPARLSGGETRRAALARVLAPDPDILLLDEPTNHLDIAAIEDLETTLAGTRSALVMISHDRRFLQDLGRATIWLDRGATRRLDRGFAEFETWRDTQLAEEEMERHKLDRTIVREEDWLRYGVTARRKRNQKRLRDLIELRAERVRRKANAGPGNVTLAVQDARLSGKLVIEADGVGKRYGERTIVRDLTLRIERGNRVGIVGPNGAGKTTVLNLLTGNLAPDAGRIRLGANLRLASLDQRRQSLDPETTVADVLTGGGRDTVVINGEARHVVSYMKDFLFAPEQARTPLKALSGGERGRLMLARALAQPSNLLVLDEPTNDLDLETLDLLQEMIASYPGTVLVVSHDRDFLDRVVTSVIASDGDGEWTEYAGGYSDMVAQRGRGIGGARPATAATARAAPRPEERPASTAPRLPPRRKLSYADQRALQTLPDMIQALNREIATLEALLSDASLYARDARAFSTSTTALAAARATLARLEEEWLTAELRREDIERTES